MVYVPFLYLLSFKYSTEVTGMLVEASHFKKILKIIWKLQIMNS